MLYSDTITNLTSLDEVNERFGRKTKYSQLTSGNLRLSGLFAHHAEFGAYTVRANLKIAATSWSPADKLMLVSPGSRRPLRINGAEVPDGSVAILTHNTESTFCSLPLGEVSVLMLPLPDEKCINSLFHVEADEVREGTTLIKSIRPQMRQFLQNTIARMHGSDFAGLDDAQVLDKLRSNVFAMLFDTDQRASNRRVKASRRAVWRAVDFIDAHLDQAFSMSEVCSYSHVTLRTLERHFRQEFGVTPVQYVRSRRLSAARERFNKSECADRSIASIAMDCGFTHLGRFSAHYRSHFGVSPRADLSGRANRRPAAADS